MTERNDNRINNYYNDTCFRQFGICFYTFLILQNEHNTRALSVNYEKNQSDNTIVTHTLKPSIIICDHVTKNDPIESIDIL